jgi:hypothetical protein
MEITLDYGGGVSSEESFDRMKGRELLFAKNHFSFVKSENVKKNQHKILEVVRKKKAPTMRGSLRFK